VRCSRFMIRPSGKLKRFMSNADYQVSTKRTKKKNPVFRYVLPPTLTERRYNVNRDADQTLLPLHLSFCRTTLKNEASGKEANGSVFLALRMVTIDPRSTWIGLRPSSVRYTG
jgi:hypothetical protein